eukprot:scaffold2615_cov151-Skeletonema_menzelii.AAC.3
MKSKVNSAKYANGHRYFTYHTTDHRTYPSTTAKSHADGPRPSKSQPRRRQHNQQDTPPLLLIDLDFAIACRFICSRERDWYDKSSYGRLIELQRDRDTSCEHHIIPTTFSFFDQA